MESSNFTVSESLKTIEAAVSETKTAKTGAYYYYLLWGGILFSYYFSFYLCTQFSALRGTLFQSFVWLVFPIGGILSYRRQGKEQVIETHVPFLERVYFWAFTGFACMVAILSVASAYLSSSILVMLFPLIIGSTVYTVGGITKHTISIVGGIFGIVLSLFSILSSMENQYLIAAISCIATCILPGISMRKSHV